MVQLFWMHEASRKNDYYVTVLALILSPETGPNMSVYGPDHHFQGLWLDIVSCHFTVLHPMVGVSSSVWWLGMETGVLYLSHAKLVQAELIVCSTRGSACILAKWVWPTVLSLCLTYGSPEASCNKRADTYFGRRSASLMKEFWTLCILVMTVFETVMVETFPYSNIGLIHCL